MDVIIVGAGAAGLMAARELTRANQKVIVLEARERIGGRIHTINVPNSKHPVEGGAEFIHGNLDLTLALLKEAGIKYEETTGEFWRVQDGKWTKENRLVEGEEQLLECLKNLKENISIMEFLNREFPGEEFKALRHSLISYIEGYYSGDPDRASALAFCTEWQTEDDQQYRPSPSYGKLIEHLAGQLTKAGAIIQTNTVVKQIRWFKDQVEVVDDTHHAYTARKVIIAVPLGIWNAKESEKGAITYIPSLTEKMEAAKRMGFGSVVKIVLQFKDCFWEDKKAVAMTEAKDFGFIFSDELIGTWWSQLPDRSPMLTGWVAGPKAARFRHVEDEKIVQQAIESLASIFGIPFEMIANTLVSSYVFNWTADPFTRGSYAYSTTDTSQAVQVMMEPLYNTLFFAGEAFYDGPEMGTVEAALISGKRVAQQVLQEQAKR